MDDAYFILSATNFLAGMVGFSIHKYSKSSIKDEPVKIYYSIYNLFMLGLNFNGFLSSSIIAWMFDFLHIKAETDFLSKVFKIVDLWLQIGGMIMIWSAFIINAAAMKKMESFIIEVLVEYNATFNEEIVLKRSVTLMNRYLYSLPLFIAIVFSHFYFTIVLDENVDFLSCCFFYFVVYVPIFRRYSTTIQLTALITIFTDCYSAVNEKLKNVVDHLNKEWRQRESDCTLSMDRFADRPLTYDELVQVGNITKDNEKLNNAYDEVLFVKGFAKFRKLRFFHDKLTDAAKECDAGYGFTIFWCIFNSFMQGTTTSYFIYVLFKTWVDDEPTIMYIKLYMLVVHLFVHVLYLVLFGILYSAAKNKMDETKEILCEANHLSATPCKRLRDEFEIFALQLDHAKFDFEALSLFTIDVEMLHSIAYEMCTLVVIQIQFNMD